MQDGSKRVGMTLPLPPLVGTCELSLVLLRRAGWCWRWCATPLARVSERSCMRAARETKPNPDATAKAELGGVAYIVTSVEFQAIAIQYQHSTARGPPRVVYLRPRRAECVRELRAQHGLRLW